MDELTHGGDSIAGMVKPPILAAGMPVRARSVHRPGQPGAAFSPLTATLRTDVMSIALIVDMPQTTALPEGAHLHNAAI
ncbi:hypothetical protein ACTMU2_10320 [Cupriavidus basilensis]